ncbi:MAG TPA: hypothetical protein P5572_06175, partial [Phycisphaerae bacterium]|nr:hypothetical protein [Phycisphaerae bacterium]
MALRLSPHVVCGEFYNHRRNSLFGRLALRGIARPLVLQLTGNAAPDLAGRCFRFEVRNAPEDDPDPSADADAAVHGLDDAADDGQSHAASQGLPVRRVLLREGLEDQRQ